MKNKGFTLIELLAVILILGIIALIAIPTVNNILKESRQGAFNASMQNIIKAAEEKCLTEHMKGNTVRQFIFTNGKVSPSLDVKGDLPKSGIINLNENCEATATLSDGDRKYVLTYEGSTVEECTSSSCSFASNLKESDEKYQCFNFDEETGTILKYDGSNPICQGDVYIPAMINNVPVVKINAAAFVNFDKIQCVKNDEVTEYDSTYIPRDEDGICYVDETYLTNNYSYNSLNMQYAGFLTEIGNSAFMGNGLTEINFNDNIKKLGIFTFALNKTNRIVLPKNLEELGFYSFYDSYIIDLVINNKLKIIPEYAFAFNGIQTINIPKGVEYIKSGAFRTEIDAEYSTVNLSNTLKGIGEEAFYHSGVKEINFGGNLEYIGEVAFMGNFIKKLDLPSSIKELGAAVFSDNNLEDPFVYNRNNDGSINNKSLNSFGGKQKTVVVPNGVEEIGKFAFDSAYVSDITLPDGLKYIREGAFWYNEFPSITIPSSVEIIEKNAFIKYVICNKVLTNIINKTGRSFDWTSITKSTTANQVFETGTIIHSDGNITVSN